MTARHALVLGVCAIAYVAGVWLALVRFSMTDGACSDGGESLGLAVALIASGLVGGGWVAAQMPPSRGRRLLAAIVVVTAVASAAVYLLAVLACGIA